jgi:class 3 adenylate cyclase/tetratricopeptide (TPR) repeat protein
VVQEASSSAGAGVAFDNPEAYMPRDRRRALAMGIELPDRVRGAALFADISGFTPLTEALAEELGSQRGAEELTANLNRVFHGIIEELDRFDGEVIYFSGDAITCWIDGDDGIRAAACGLAMQEAMERVGEIRTPAGQVLRLAMKVAVAVGPARRFVVGDPEIQLIDVLAGRIIDQLAAAEHLTEKGEVVLEQSALEALEGRVEVGQWRIDPESGRRAGVLKRLTEDAPEAPDVQAHYALTDDLVRPWLLPAVYERLSTGRGEFLAELRPAIPVFVRFSGIDYDEDDDAIEKLDDFIRRSQRVFEEHGGHLLQLTLGDKGAYLYAVFGSPHAHEDDARRAAAAALEILELDGQTAARELQLGIAKGRLRSGTYGHAMRRTFVCLGDAVNLAARLMSHAWPGQVLATEDIQDESGGGFTWEQLDDLTVKGKEEPVAAFALTGQSRAAGARQVRYELPIVGRVEELAALDAALAQAEEAHGSVVGISADAGVGKSRLVAEFVRKAREHGVLVAFGETSTFGTNATYGVWQEIWRTLFRIEEGRPEDEQLETLERELAAVDPGLVPRAPLLEPLLGLAIPDNELTGGLDAEVRKSSLEALLADCLRARAAEEPIVLVLEDCHWIDELSRDLLRTLARAAASLRVLLVTAYRPAEDGATGGSLDLGELEHFSEITLSPLGSEEAEELIRAKVAQAAAKTEAGMPALVELLTARAEGNPFYLEELLNYIGGQQIDVGDSAALGAIELPESLHSLILSRVDTLPEAPRRTIKVASVVGRAFDVPTLVRVYPELGSEDEVGSHLRRLKTLDLVALDRGDDSYLFKHAVTQEVTYESMPFSFRAMLHERVAADLETTQPDAVDLNLDLLASHYWLSENTEKKKEYLVRAGEAAKANYANESAIDYLERAAPLLDPPDRWRVWREVGEVREVLGDWPGAESTYREALELGEAHERPSAIAWTHTSLADLFRKRGDLEEASWWAESAHERFEELGDREGLGRVLQLSGTIAAMRGDFDAGRPQLEASLEIRHELGDAAGAGALLSNLGVMAEYEGDYERSRALHEEGLALRIEAGDKGAIAISQMNLGNVLLLLGRPEEARACQEESLRLRRETGDPWMIALGEHNLGILLRAEGDYDATRELFAAALGTFRDHGDKWALAFILEDVAVLAVLVGEPAVALRLGGAGAAVREDTGSPRGEADRAELDAQLAPARAELGERAEALWEAGRLGGLDDAIRTALRLCERR